MEFGSKYVYEYADSDEENVSDNEFEMGMDVVSDPLAYLEEGSSEAIVTATAPIEACSQETGLVCYKAVIAHQPRNHHMHHWMKPFEPAIKDAVAGSAADSVVAVRPPSKKWRRANTNVVAIQFDQLILPSNMHTGDQVNCTVCQATLSHISKIMDDGGEKKVWKCEFCGERNLVDVLPEEIPTKSDVTYMLQPATQAAAADSGRSFADESLIIFCIDFSGSMNSKVTVPGKLKIRGSSATSQWIRSENRYVTTVTSLQCLQAAVDYQLEALAKDHPNCRVALVAFDSKVIIIGDGMGKSVTVSGTTSHEELVRIGSTQELPEAISGSRGTLGKTLFDLHAGESTALGPALLISVHMASKVRGSKVIICTDGCANVGVGDLRATSDDQALEKAGEFYSQLAHVAKEKGVSVSVLTIAGCDSRLKELGIVADLTEGKVNTVDPLNLTQEFSSILSDPIIATHVVATFLVHAGLYIRDEPDKTSRVVRDVGNVIKDTELTFEYGIKHDPDKTKNQTDDEVESGEEVEAVDDGLSELPFQVQISYTDLEGAKAVRVLTETKPVTRKREQAEEFINMPVVGAHATQLSSRLALSGDYTDSRLNALVNQRLLYRNSKTRSQQIMYQSYLDQVKPIEDNARVAQIREAASANQRLQDYEGAGPSNALKLSRRRECTDDFAKDMYQKSRPSSKKMKSFSK